MLDKPSWLKRVTTRPILYFALAFWISIAVLWIVLQLLSAGNDGWGALLPASAALELSSNGMQAVVGNAVVGASAVVALIVTVAALRASEQGNQLTAHSNELGDPDYLLSHQAYGAYRKYGFLMGSLIADYRLFKHERDQNSYAKSGGDSGANDDSMAGFRSRKIHEELRALLFDTSFSVASLEAARALDRQRDTFSARTEQHNLRKAFVGLNAALDGELSSGSNVASAEAGLTWVLAQANLLDVQIRHGIAAVVALPEPATGPSEHERFLQYLKRWMGNIDPVETGADLRNAARANAFSGEEFLSLAGGLRSAAELLSVRLHSIFVENSGWISGGVNDRSQIGMHESMRIAALFGDHSTILNLVRTAEEFARSNNWDPEVVVINSKASLPNAPQADDDKRFFIFQVTRRTLPLLFEGKCLNPYVRGCVLVDGLRTGDLCWVEDKLEKDAEEQSRRRNAIERDGAPQGDSQGRAMKAESDGLRAFVALLANAAANGSIRVPNGDGSFYQVNREERALASIHQEKGMDESSRKVVYGPKLLWVGIDYRKLAMEPPNRLDDYTREMHSIFGWKQHVAVSDEVRQLTGL